MKKEELDHFRVTIFGSARIKKTDKDYKQIVTLAKMLGQHEIDVITGGGPGIMHAANHGHKMGSNGNAHSIGLNIKLPFEQSSNKHLDISKEFEHFSDRLDEFMRLSNVVVVAPGGVGTLLEFFYTWQLAQVEHICNIPIILFGEMYLPLLDWIKKYMLKRNLIGKKDMDNIFYAKTCTEAMKIIKEADEQHKKGHKNVCHNIKKYKR